MTPCLLALTLSCLFDPANVYVAAGLDMQTTNRDNVRLVNCYETAYCVRPAFSGPIGTLRLGMEVRLTNGVTIDLGLSHRSYVNTNLDRGQESVYASLTWRPFR